MTRRRRRRMALLVTAATLYATAGLLWWATHASGGAIVHGMTVSLTLAAGLVFVPLLTGSWLATDRRSGLLDVLLTTRCRPGHLLLGKLLAASAVLGVYALLVVPPLVPAVTSGGVDLASFALAPVLIWSVLLAVAALGLGVSAVSSRTGPAVAGASALSAALVVGTVVAFGALLALTPQERPRHVSVVADSAAGPTRPGAGTDPRCAIVSRTLPTGRPDLWWWLLALNPVVIVADGAPATRQAGTGFDPLALTSQWVRSARSGPEDALVRECSDGTTEVADLARRSAEVAPVWPVGLAALALAGGLALLVASSRMRTPRGPEAASLLSRWVSRLPRSREDRGGPG